MLKKFFNRFNEIKSHWGDVLLPKSVKNSSDKHTLYGVYNFLSSYGLSNLSARQAINYYECVSPVFSSLDKISEHVAAIKPVVINKKTQEVILDHEVLQLLQAPNEDMTYTEFIKQLCVFYLLTGNVFLLGMGNPKRPPLEIHTVGPQYVSIFQGSDGFAGEHQVANWFSRNMTFMKQEGKLREPARFIDSRELLELWHIKTPNLGMASGNDFFGTSPLASIFYEIEQYIMSNVHNISLLSNGAKLSGILESNGDFDLDDEQFEQFKRKIVSQYTGPNSAGKLLFLENGITFKPAMQSNRDMDFVALRNSVKESIFDTLKVPISLVSSENMTMNNMEVGRIMLYESAVIPVAKRLFKELTRFLMPKYDKTGNLEITFLTDDIEALELRQLAKIKQKTDLQVFKINEIRQLLGAEEIENGEELTKRSTGTKVNNEGDSEPKVDEEKFTRIMNAQGQYTEKQIKDFYQQYKDS